MFAEALQKRHGTNWQLLLQRTAEMMVDLGNNNLLNRDAFSKIKNKVLIGLADGDTMVSVVETDNASSKIVGAKRYTLQSSNHPIESVNIGQLVNVVGEFLK